VDSVDLEYPLYWGDPADGCSKAAWPRYAR
jgi:hypothetical protein